MHLALLPVAAELVRGDGHRREAAGGFGLEEAKALGELPGNEVAQAHIVDQHQQLDVLLCPLRAGAHGHVVCDDGHFRFKVDAPLLRPHDDGAAGGEEAVGAPLIHQRIVPEAVRHLGAARLAHQLHVVDVGAAVGPLVGAGQRGKTGGLIEGEGIGAGAVVEGLIDGAQPGGEIAPLVQRPLQGGGYVGHGHRPGQIPAHHHQGAIALAIVQGCQFHIEFLICRGCRLVAASWKHSGGSLSPRRSGRPRGHPGCRASQPPRR